LEPDYLPPHRLIFGWHKPVEDQGEDFEEEQAAERAGQIEK
jgi:hypothetical protein